MLILLNPSLPLRASHSAIFLKLCRWCTFMCIYWLQSFSTILQTCTRRGSSCRRTRGCRPKPALRAHCALERAEKMRGKIPRRMAHGRTHARPARSCGPGSESRSHKERRRGAPRAARTRPEPRFSEVGPAPPAPPPPRHQGRIAESQGAAKIWSYSFKITSLQCIQ